MLLTNDLTEAQQFDLDLENWDKKFKEWQRIEELYAPVLIFDPLTGQEVKAYKGICMTISCHNPLTMEDVNEHSELCPTCFNNANGYEIEQRLAA